MVLSLTPTQDRMLSILADGLPHTRRELHGCLYDDQGALGNIRNHIAALRKKLRPLGQDIVCELSSGAICYRQVRLLKSA